jgi:type IV pilus assembly protein PilA
MLEKLMERRRHGSEEGFTLIELMVVVLIIAILIAIAIPTFLGARQRAQNRSAQSNMRNALTAEKTTYTDTQAYTAVSATLSAIEPTLTYVTAVPAAGTREVYVATGTSVGGVANDTVVIGAHSASGNCYWLQDTANGASAGTKWSTSTSCAAVVAVNDASFTSLNPPTS